MSFEPGNPNGWGDPMPLIYLLLGLVVLGSFVDRLGITADYQEQCERILQTSVSN
jgi:hypothetical protein